MSGRHRTFHTAASIATLVVCLLLLVHTVTSTNRLTASRAANAAQTSAENRRLLRNVRVVLDNVRQTQIAQQKAFRALAQRNEVLHGNDPDDAPDFGTTESSNPPTKDGQSGTDRDPAALQRPDPQREEPPRKEPPRKERPRPPPDDEPDPPDPTPPPERLCVPLLDVCVDEP